MSTYFVVSRSAGDRFTDIQIVIAGVYYYRPTLRGKGSDVRSPYPSRLARSVIR